MSEKRKSYREEQITASEPKDCFRLSTKGTRTMCLRWRHKDLCPTLLHKTTAGLKLFCQRLETHCTPFGLLALWQTTLSALLQGSFCITDKDRTSTPSLSFYCLVIYHFGIFREWERQRAWFGSCPAQIYILSPSLFHLHHHSISLPYIHQTGGAQGRHLFTLLLFLSLMRGFLSLSLFSSFSVTALAQ